MSKPERKTKTTNPFKSSSQQPNNNRTNFPPLDDFFNPPPPPQPPSSRPLRGSPTKSDYAMNTSTISLDHSSVYSRSIVCNELNFSIDMSIAGRAEMAQHRYQVQKYGLDGINGIGITQTNTSMGSASASASPNNKNKSNDTWDRIMDDNYSHVSFSSTAIVAGTPSPNTKKKKHHPNDGGEQQQRGSSGSVSGSSQQQRFLRLGYQTPSPDQSSDEGSTSFFDKSYIIQSLATPEKIRFQMTNNDNTNNIMNNGERNDVGVTLARGGQACDDSSSTSSGDDSSPARRFTSSNDVDVSTTTSIGSGFEGMFSAALRFNQDFEEEQSSSFATKDDDDDGSDNNNPSTAKDNDDDDESFPNDRDKNNCSGGDKSTSVSFAANKSFASSGSLQHGNYRKQPRNKPQDDDTLDHTKNGPGDLKGLYLMSASPIKSQIKEENLSAFQGLEFMASSSPGLIGIGHHHKQRHKQSSFSSPSFPNMADRSEISSIASSACSTPQNLRGYRGTSTTHPSVSQQSASNHRRANTSPSNLLLLGLSPIDSPNAAAAASAAAGGRALKSPPLSSIPFDERHATSSEPLEEYYVPFDERLSHCLRMNKKSQSSTTIVSAKKHLFSEEEEEEEQIRHYASSPLTLEINNTSVELVHKKSNTLDQCCTNTTVKSEISYLDDGGDNDDDDDGNDIPLISTSLSEDASPFAYSRTFGSNAAFGINNSNENNEHSQIMSCYGDRNRRGVRLSRLSKMKELGLGHALALSRGSPPTEQSSDTSF